MPIQPHFEVDVGGAFPQQPQKAKNSPANLMDFVFKEYIQKEESAAPSSSQTKKSESSNKDSDSQEVVSVGEEDVVDAEGSAALAPVVLTEILLPEDLDPEQALTMKQLDQAMGQSLTEEIVVQENPLPELQPQPKEVSLKKEPLALEIQPLELQETEDFSKALMVKDLEPKEETSLSKDETVELFQEAPQDLEEEVTFSTKPFFESKAAPLAPFQESVSRTIDITPSPIITVPDITAQVLDQIPRDLFSIQGNHQVKIQLYPAELGEVTIDLKIGDKKQIQAIFSAASSGTLDLLRQDSSQLLQALKKEGFDVASENFQFNSNDGNAKDQASKAPSFSALKEAPSSLGDAFERRSLSSKRVENNLIDIRVH